MDLRDLDVKLSRRMLLQGSTLGAMSLVSIPGLAHNDAGVVAPKARPPELLLTLHDGAATTLQKHLKGRATAVQMMFTSCRATCPIQGGLFARAAKLLGERLKPAQLLSISIDPGNDKPEKLREWLKRHGESPRWKGAIPRSDQLKTFMDFLKARSEGPDPHTGQVYYFDQEGDLVLRSVDFPPATEVVRVLTAIVEKS